MQTTELSISNFFLPPNINVSIDLINQGLIGLQKRMKTVGNVAILGHYALLLNLSFSEKFLKATASFSLQVVFTVDSLIRDTEETPLQPKRTNHNPHCAVSTETSL